MTRGLEKRQDSVLNLGVGTQDQMQRALLLTVKWNRPDYARKIILSLPASQDYSAPVSKMLQSSLELQRVEIVKLLIERPNQDVEGINMSQLYMLEDRFNFLRKDHSLQHRIQRNLADIFHDKAEDKEDKAKSSYRLFKAIVGPFMLRNFASFIYDIVEVID